MTTTASRRQLSGTVGSARRSRFNLRVFTPVLFLVPTLIFLGTFLYYPAVKIISDSFYYYDGAIRNFVGIDNYTNVLFSIHEDRFWPSMLIAIRFGVFNVAKVLIFPLLAAKLIHLLIQARQDRPAYWYRFLLIIPTVVPGLITVFIWRIFFHPSAGVGLFNTVLDALGLPLVRWLTDPEVAFYSLVLIGFPWIGGFSMLIYLAGLQTIPAELYDAAEVDGASSWSMFWAVEIPLIRSQISLLLLFAVIGSLQDFGTQFVMTGGGPKFSTLVPGLLMYQRAFGENHFGLASAMAVILFVFTFGLSYLNLRYVNKRIDY